MSLTFQDLQDEVKRRGTRNQSGTTFDTAIKNLINTSLFRVSREAPWRPMRKKSFFNTKATYTTGTGAGAFTLDSTTVTITGATFLTDAIEIGRKIKLSGDGTYHTIRTITSETALTIEKSYSGTTTTTGTYSILGQEQYNLSIQAGHRMFMWHEENGSPYLMAFIPEQTFWMSGTNNNSESTPTCYRMWGEDMIITQLRAASVIRISSSSSSDTSIQVTVFGVVSGYPDYEVITTNASNGTTAVDGSKSFTSVERIVKASSSVGRITATANSANTTVAVLPVGDTTAGILYRKVQLYPLPNTVFPINIYFYKDPYRLVNAGDVHELGQEFDEAIMLLATAKLKYESNQNEGDKFAGLYLDEIRSLRKLYVDKIDFFPKLQRPGLAPIGLHPHLSYSQIGANYGPMSY